MQFAGLQLIVKELDQSLIDTPRGSHSVLSRLRVVIDLKCRIPLDNQANGRSEFHRANSRNEEIRSTRMNSSGNGEQTRRRQNDQPDVLSRIFYSVVRRRIS